MPQNTITTTASVPVPENKLRVSIMFTNIDTTNDIYMDSSRVSVVTTGNAGIKLRPGDAIAFNALVDGQAQVQDLWRAITDAGTPTLIWFETESVER